MERDMVISGRVRISKWHDTVKVLVFNDNVDSNTKSSQLLLDEEGS